MLSEVWHNLSPKREYSSTAILKSFVGFRGADRANYVGDGDRGGLQYTSEQHTASSAQ